MGIKCTQNLQAKPPFNLESASAVTSSGAKFLLFFCRRIKMRAGLAADKIVDCKTVRILACVVWAEIES